MMRFAWLFLFCYLMPATAAAQQPADGRFGCFGPESLSPSLYKRPNLKFEPLFVQQRTQAELEQGEVVPCQWVGLVHWKAGAGFRVRKLSEDCKASPRVIFISDDGTIKAAASK